MYASSNYLNPHTLLLSVLVCIPNMECWEMKSSEKIPCVSDIISEHRQFVIEVLGSTVVCLKPISHPDSEVLVILKNQKMFKTPIVK